MGKQLQLVIKRELDVVLSLVTLLLLSPLLALLAIGIKLDTGGPVLFRQARLGLHGRKFQIYKFRTMRDFRDSSDELLPDSDRLTRFGRFLRRTSLDELPELLNVLRAEMSLVGPRPLLAHYAGRYTPEQRRRHEVRPGITGLAQARGRNAINWEQKFALDVWYVDNWNLWLDTKILALTVWKVFRGEGINQSGQATAEEFRGAKR